MTKDSSNSKNLFRQARYKLINLLIIISIFIISCKEKRSNSNMCSIIQNDTIGRVIMSLPNCYKVFFPDKDLHPGDAFLMNGDSVKLRLLVNGAASVNIMTDLQKDSSIIIQTDTISNHYFRQIGYFKNGDNFGIVLNIVNIEPMPTVSGDSVHHYILLIQAYTTVDVSLKQKEKDFFLNSFKNIKIID